MKKILLFFRPISIVALSFLIVSAFLRYYLYVSSKQLIREFKNQNYREIYSLDTLKISSRLNSLSSAINWVCIEAQIDNKPFYLMEKNKCESGIFQQRQELHIAEANNIRISFTVKLPREIEYLFFIFLLLQIALIVSIVLVTKKIETEKHLNEIKLNKLVRQTFHDIRSPLATLNTIHENIKNIPDSDKTLMAKSIERINDIANELLNVSKTQAVFHSPPKREACQLNDVLSEIIESKKIEFQKNINLAINYNSNTLKAICIIDETEFKNIISNLINNSVESEKSLKKFVNINISLKTENKNAVVQIEDNGQGMPEHILKKIGKHELTTKKRGNGLGLFHAYECIHEWNGNIKISSEIKKGTSVKILLPIVTKETTVLIDDDELVRLTWQSVANKANIDFIALSKIEELYEILINLDFASPIYIDSQLGNGIAGEDIAKELHHKGFNNIYITSGYQKEKFANLHFLKGVKDKSPPWTS